MDEVNIFAIGVIVTVLFAVGVIYTIKEFKRMYSGKEQGLREGRSSHMNVKKKNDE